MGLEAVDTNTIGHVVWGMSSRIAIPPRPGVSAFGSFFLANAIHACSELNENSRAPDGRELQSSANRVVDIAAFAAGWLLTHLACKSVLGPCNTSASMVFWGASLWFWGTLVYEVWKEVAMRRAWEVRARRKRRLGSGRRSAKS